MKKTPLYDTHKALDAKLVDFAGWEMPLQYRGIISEHQAVRTAAGLFDVSHMGAIEITGPDALQLVQNLSTNDITNKPNNSVIYTVMCDENGRCLDDVLVYKRSPQTLFIVANASNRDKIHYHIEHYAKGQKLTVMPRYEGEGILSLQGPRAPKILQKLFPKAASLTHMHFLHASYKNVPIDISQTGYTGELGYEFFVDNSVLVDLWNDLMAAGNDLGIQPTGLGARDTLRLEMGYALYGHELDETIAPTETVSAWTVKGDHPYLGREAIEALEASPTKRHQYGVILEDRGIARQGCPVFRNGKNIGTVTSGTFAPSLQRSIAIVFVDTKLLPNDMVSIEVRGTLHNARVVKLPFKGAT